MIDELERRPIIVDPESALKPEFVSDVRLVRDVRQPAGEQISENAPDTALRYWRGQQPDHLPADLDSFLRKCLVVSGSDYIHVRAIWNDAAELVASLGPFMDIGQLIRNAMAAVSGLVLDSARSGDPYRTFAHAELPSHQALLEKYATDPTYHRYLESLHQGVVFAFSSAPGQIDATVVVDRMEDRPYSDEQKGALADLLERGGAVLDYYLTSLKRNRNLQHTSSMSLVTSRLRECRPELFSLQDTVEAFLEEVTKSIDHECFAFFCTKEPEENRLELTHLVHRKPGEDPAVLELGKAPSIPIREYGGISGHAAYVRRLVYFPDIEFAKDKLNLEYFAFPGMPDMKSGMAYPILLGGKIIGVIGIESRQRFSLGHEAASLLFVVAAYLADHWRLFSAMSRRELRFREARAALAQFRNLEVSGEEEAPDAALLSALEADLREFAEVAARSAESAEEPWLSVSSDGGIVADWKSGGRRLVVTYAGPDRRSYYARLENGEERYGAVGPSQLFSLATWLVFGDALGSAR